MLQQSSTKWNDFQFNIHPQTHPLGDGVSSVHRKQTKAVNINCSKCSLPSAKAVSTLNFWNGSSEAVEGESSELTVKAADDSNAVWRCFHSCVFGVVTSAPRVFPLLVFLTCGGEKTQSAALAKQLIPGQSHVVSFPTRTVELGVVCFQSVWAVMQWSDVLGRRTWVSECQLPRAVFMRSS